MTPKFLGGKTYFFINYEGYRFPNATTFERTVPTPLLKLGVIQIQTQRASTQALTI